MQRKRRKIFNKRIVMGRILVKGALVLCAVMFFCAGAQAKWKRLSSAQIKLYKLSGFTGVVVSLPGEVEVSQGENYSVRGESKYDGILEAIDVTVKNGNLVVDASEEVHKQMAALRRYPLFKLHVTTPRVELLGVAGSGDVRVVTDVTTETLTVSLTGSGEVHTRGVQCRGDVFILLAGSGNINLGALHGRKLISKITGSGDIKMSDVELGGDAELLLAGSGDMALGDVRAAALSAKIAGSGSIQTLGVQVDKSVEAACNGSGDIKMGAARGASMQLAQEGSGEIEVASATVDRLGVKLEMSGGIEVKGGSSGVCEVSLTGAGDIDLQRLTAREADVLLRGSGEVKMTVTDVVYMDGGMPSSTLSVEGGARMAGKRPAGHK